MDLRRIICEELESQEFQGIIDMIDSKQLDSIALALLVAKGTKLDKQFEEHFGISLKKYTEIFNKVILVISKNNKMPQSFVQDFLDVSLNPEQLDSNISSYIVTLYPKFHIYFNLMAFSAEEILELLLAQSDLYKYCDLSKLDRHAITKLISVNPKLVTALDLEKLSKDDISIILHWNKSEYEQLKPYFDKLK